MGVDLWSSRSGTKESKVEMSGIFLKKSSGSCLLEALMCIQLAFMDTILPAPSNFVHFIIVLSHLEIVISYKQERVNTRAPMYDYFSIWFKEFK